MNKQRRRQAFSRRLREKKAVSPVVATLILILIAVAAAAALYLWLVAWQGGVTKTVGTPSPQYTISIGGSTTVYPLDVIAVNWFEQNNSGVTVNNQQGGSGAGVVSVCAGALDIGASSSLQSSTTLTSDGCPATTVQTPIGYDGVDLILDPTAWSIGTAGATATTCPTTPTADHCLPTILYGSSATTYEPALSLNQSDVTAIYECNGNGTSFGNAAAAYSLASAAPWFVTSTGTYSNGCGGGYVTWGDLLFPAGCDSYAATTTVPKCVQDTGSDALDLIHIYHRADNSGTEQSFVQLLMGTPSTSGGCGVDKGNELSECGISARGEVGNPALLTAVAGDPNGIGFNSNGIIASTEGSKASTYVIPFEGPGQSAAVAPSVTSILSAVSANCGSGTTTTCTNSQYYGWRVLEYVTTNTPTGEAYRFIQFVVGSEVNQDLATATGYISIYAPGAPPPTPVVY